AKGYSCLPMDSFDDCGIRYLTAGSLNLWREAPGLWVLEHLYGIKGGMNAALARMIAVKSGVTSWLYRGNLNDAENVGLLAFANPMAGVDDPDIASSEDSILELISGTVKEFQRLGLGISEGQPPVCCGLANSVWIDGITIPLLTAPDFVFTDQ